MDPGEARDLDHDCPHCRMGGHRYRRSGEEGGLGHSVAKVRFMADDDDVQLGVSKVQLNNAMQAGRAGNCRDKAIKAVKGC